MKKFLCLLAMSFGILASAGSGGASAQTAQNGPYYATPSWDQHLPAATRFVVLANFNNDAVLDRETGLVWQRSPDQSLQIDWTPSVGLCWTATTGNRGGWRLPSVEEIESLMDPNTFLPPAGHPFIGISSALGFWTATTWPSDPTLALNFVTGIVNGAGTNLVHKTTGHEIHWCVRGGAGLAFPTN